MENQSLSIHLIISIASFAIGCALTYFLSKNKISTIQSTLQSKSNEHESALKIHSDKYRNLEITSQTLESSLKSVINTEIENNKVLQNIIKDLRDSSQKTREAYEEKIETLRASYEEKMETLRKEELTVITFPYEEQMGDDGFITDDRRAEIGYKYQLFIKGVPCFEPHKVPVQILQKKEVNLEKIKEIKNLAMDTIEKIASMHPAVKALSSAPNVIKSSTK